MLWRVHEQQMAGSIFIHERIGRGSQACFHALSVHNVLALGPLHPLTPHQPLPRLQYFLKYVLLLLLLRIVRVLKRTLRSVTVVLNFRTTDVFTHGI